MYALYTPGLFWHHHWCPHGRLALGSSSKARQASSVSLQHPGSASPFPSINTALPTPPSVHLGEVKLFNLLDLIEDPVNLLFSTPTATQAADLLQLYLADSSHSTLLLPAGSLPPQASQRDQVSPESQMCRSASTCQSSARLKASGVPE